ncbi:hypothetical protein S7711_01545 [Stachybotrys chartarum IBT 7711]|uniref:Uncharacterized protein n=1 Tax=Stachybotrys chartarum (strain CBS 109288 / IBT 7711) TaxID=1280523 RepID=A0A084BC03_STACB|nr:hypothetical protein S7711_01545 [Stachybotrys chartarum IBT 7711]KFA55877.1 hypothetical protein S40293_06950 [Stachybotrys chartarum IBT 40293]KFA71624.1 hypothetical protein S40288_03658 [Stachybotrys chartarum IBT 40288]
MAEVHDANTSSTPRSTNPTDSTPMGNPETVANPRRCDAASVPTAQPRSSMKESPLAYAAWNRSRSMQPVPKSSKEDSQAIEGGAEQTIMGARVRHDCTGAHWLEDSDDSDDNGPEGLETVGGAARLGNPGELRVMQAQPEDSSDTPTCPPGQAPPVHEPSRDRRHKMRRSTHGRRSFSNDGTIVPRRSPSVPSDDVTQSPPKEARWFVNSVLHALLLVLQCIVSVGLFSVLVWSAFATWEKSDSQFFGWLYPLTMPFAGATVISCFFTLFCHEVQDLCNMMLVWLQSVIFLFAMLTWLAVWILSTCESDHYIRGVLMGSAVCLWGVCLLGLLRAVVVLVARDMASRDEDLEARRAHHDDRLVPGEGETRYGTFARRRREEGMPGASGNYAFLH